MSEDGPTRVMSAGGRSFNELAAERLQEAAALPEHQGDNSFRVAAYRRATETTAWLENNDVRDLLGRAASTP